MGCVLEGPTLKCICEPQAVHEHFLLMLVMKLFIMFFFHNVGGMDFPGIANMFVGCVVFFCVSAAISQMMT